MTASKGNPASAPPSSGHHLATISHDGRFWDVYIEFEDDPRRPDIEFRRGDANSDSKHNITDAVFILRYLFTGGQTPSCLKAADTNDTGDLDLTDAIYLLNYLFLGGSEPSAPFPACGPDPTVDDLSCAVFDPCVEP